MHKIIPQLNAYFFLGMGIIALIKPHTIVNTFGLTTIEADMRNEVRAVYGGFGLAMSGLLFASSSLPRLEKGIHTTIACSLFGMAIGRSISALIERPQTKVPLYFCILETTLASSLIYHTTIQTSEDI